MIITPLSYKGGEGKSTFAVHLAAWLNENARTALIDGDDNRIAVAWHATGKGLPFTVVGEGELAKASRTHEHLVIDTPARPKPEKFHELARSSDQIILVCQPRGMSLNALGAAIRDLEKLKVRYRVLVCRARPATHEAFDTLDALTRQGLPHFVNWIPEYIVAGKAFEQGRLCRDIDNAHALELWEAYGRVAQEVLNG
jgi:chromosome partitioning protein